MALKDKPIKDASWYLDQDHTGLTLKQQTFVYSVPGYDLPLRWDIGRAKAQVEAGHVLASVFMQKAQLQEVAERDEWDENHLAHVDPRSPGIAVPVIWEGQITYVLIDGVHRAVRNLREGNAFLVALLTDDAARACFIDGPRELLP